MSTPVSTTFDGLASVDRYGNLAPVIVDRLDERYPAAAAIGGRLGEVEAEVDRQVAATGTPLEAYGVDGAAQDNSAALATAITDAVTSGARLVGRPGAVYKVTKNVLVDVPEGKSLNMDMGGATLDFSGGAWMRLGKQVPAPYLTTTSSAGVTRRGTHVVVADATGVQVGDLMTITSPVEAGTGITARQTYVVADVDTTTRQVWVEGRIVGDLTPAQITAAGKSGNIGVEFRRPSARIALRNVTLTSTNRDGGDNLVLIGGARHVDLQDVYVDSPQRTGVNTVYCGTVKATNTTAERHGYNVRDRGYASLPSDPGGYGFGYGFVYSDCYSVQIRHANGYSGWHSHDVARGVSYSLWDGLVSHKDAFGASTHEGAWVMEVRNSVFNGGNGITCRAMELIVDSCRIDTSLGEAIISGSNLQRLHIRNTTIDLSDVDNSAPAFGILPTTSRRHLLSAASADALLDGVHIIGATAESTIATSGNLTLRNVTTDADSAGGTSAIRCTYTGSGQGVLSIISCSSVNVAGQFMWKADGWSSINLLDTHQTGAVSNPGSSALLYVTGTNAPQIRAERCSTAANAVIRASGTGAKVETHGCAAPYMLHAGTSETFKAATGCRTRQQSLTFGSVAGPTVAAGNVVVPA